MNILISLHTITALLYRRKEDNTLDIRSLEVFEQISWVMAKHADPENVPDEIDDWLEQFGIFSIYEILSQLIELWGINLQTQVQAKKTSLN